MVDVAVPKEWLAGFAHVPADLAPATDWRGAAAGGAEENVFLPFRTSRGRREVHAGPALATQVAGPHLQPLVDARRRVSGLRRGH